MGRETRVQNTERKGDEAVGFQLMKEQGKQDRDIRELLCAFLEIRMSKWPARPVSDPHSPPSHTN